MVRAIWRIKPYKVKLAKNPNLYYIEKRKGVTKMHLTKAIRFQIKERHLIAKELRDEKEEKYHTDQKGKNNQRRLSYILNTKCPIWFRRIHRPGEKFDKKGIDFFLEVYLSDESVKTLRVQVKSSAILATRFIHFGITHQLDKVAVVTVNDYLEDRDIIFHLERRIRGTIRGRLRLLGDELDQLD